MSEYVGVPVAAWCGINMECCSSSGDIEDILVMDQTLPQATVNLERK